MRDAVVERSITVTASAEAVWDVLAAFDRLSTWAEDVEHSTYLTDQTEGVGSARRVPSRACPRSSAAPPTDGRCALPVTGRRSP